MLPANERLERHETPRGRRHDGLIVQQELAAFDRMPNLGLELQLGLGLLVHPVVEEGALIAAEHLCLVHGGVRIATDVGRAFML